MKTVNFSETFFFKQARWRRKNVKYFASFQATATRDLRKLSLIEKKCDIKYVFKKYLLSYFTASLFDLDVKFSVQYFYRKSL